MTPERRRDPSSSRPSSSSSRPAGGAAAGPGAGSAGSSAGSAGSTAASGAGSGAGSTGPRRLRPSPTSALSPAPGSLMPVPDDPTPAESGRAGRRQHHRPAAARDRPDAEDLVYLSGRIPRGLRDELHVRAIGEGRPVVELMRDALRGYLDQHTGSGR